ncbi:conjugal transfer protein TraX [Salmonella enterica]|nr:conjugal transfer protein TraX [Salmonella enterica]
MKKVTKKAFFAANLVLPLWETGRIVNAARYAAKTHADRFRKLVPEKSSSEEEELTFSEAVKASGHSRESLIRRYLLAKRIWLTMFVIAAGLVLLLPIATFSSGVPMSGVLMFRLLSMMFMLCAFAGMLFVNAMKNQFRLWQLACMELGAFAQWRASTAWVKEVFNWRSPI